jgi:PPP family 3-phenylpropionic acid transporter
MAPAARLRSFYFLYYGCVGALLPYFAPYLRGLGFSGAEIGAVQMIGPVVAAPAAIAWSTAADRLRAPARALALATLWSAIAIAFLPLARAPLAVGLVLLLQALADRAVVPLVDSVTLEWVRAEPRLAYARIRLFGSLGYVAVAQGLGLVLAARGDRPGDPLVPLAIAGLVAGYAAVARGLPSPPATGARPALRDMTALLRDGALLALLLACATHWAACAPFHLLFGVFVRDEGLPSSVTGLAMAVGVGAEVLALLAYPRLEARLGVRPLFCAAFLGSAVRWALTARAGGAAEIVAAQGLHALSFGLYWGAAVNAVARIVPPRLRATGQALFSAIVFGGGNALGFSLSGAGYDRLGGVRPLFAIAAGAELAALAIYLLAARHRRRRPG